jgi:hypothetical protein
MATDMDVTTATFGTGSLLLASGDPITDDTGSAWGGQVAQNTGWLYYQPRNVFCSGTTVDFISESSGTVDIYGYVYLAAGVYSIYACVTVDVNTPDHGMGYVFFDGTKIAAQCDDGTATGSLCGWSAGTAGWYAIMHRGSTSGDRPMTTHCGVALRFGSYAP